jgi:hypothetical protein
MVWVVSAVKKYSDVDFTIKFECLVVAMKFNALTDHAILVKIGHCQDQSEAFADQA